MNVCPTLLPEDQNFAITLPPAQTKFSPDAAQPVSPSAHSNCPLAITLLPSLTNVLTCYQPAFTRGTSWQCLGTLRVVKFSVPVSTQ